MQVRGACVGRTLLSDAFDVGVGVACALNTVGLGWAGQIRVVTSFSGSSEVSATSPNSKSNLNPNINSKIKSVGQECPTHTGYLTSLPFAVPRAIYSLPALSLSLGVRGFDGYIPAFLRDSPAIAERGRRILPATRDPRNLRAY